MAGELLDLNESYLEAQRAEIEAARRILAPGPEASEEERAAWAQLPEYIREATEALQKLEETLRQQRIEESRNRQKAVQWELVRLRLRRTMGRQTEDRRRSSAALMSRVLPSDRSLGKGMGEADWSESRKYLRDAMENFRGGYKLLPPEEILGETKILLEFFSILQQPGPREAASEQRLYETLAEHARELRNLIGNVEKQIAMKTMAERALSVELKGSEEN